MPDNQAEQKPSDVQPEMQYVDVSFPTIYTNSIGINSTVFEFALMVMERFDQETSTIKARIVMVPAHAKLLYKVLGEHIELWEKRHGDIRMPKPIVSSEPEQQP
jgi:hypothetical protein